MENIAEGTSFTVDPVCGSGSGMTVLTLGLALGLLSLAGSSGLMKRRKKRS